MDEDVLNEKEKTMHSSDMLRIMDVSKIYEKNLFSFFKKEKQVLNHVYLSIKKGECFGLLGPNGAGKSTLMNIITGIMGTNSGTVYLNNFDVLKNPSKVYNHLGVCAQEDRLWEKLTGREQYFNFILTKKRPNLHISTRNEIHRELFENIGNSLILIH
jgi:ABC-type multidrug transport system ATPase subunit